MDQELSQKIIKDIGRFSEKKYAITDEFGYVMAKTDNFSLLHNPLDIKSTKKFPIRYDNIRIGFLFIDENPQVVKEMGGIVKSMAELIVHHFYFSKFLTQDEKRIDQLVFEYFRSDSPNKKEILQLLQKLGVILSDKRVAIIVELTDDYFFNPTKQLSVGEREQRVARIKRNIKFTIDSFYTNHPDNQVFYMGGDMFLILKDMGTSPLEYEPEFKKTLNSLFYDLREEIRAPITIGIGKFCKGYQGKIESFEEALTALRFGKQTWGVNQLYHFDSFGVVAPLFSGVNEHNISISKNLVKNLEIYPELLESLKVYFDSNISLSKASKKLRIHRNTLIYRLDKIADLTKLNPRSFNEAFQLYIALILSRL